MTKEVEEFLRQSNAIEREYSDEALEDASKAWEYAYNNRDNISVSYVLEIHRLLLQRLRPDIAGKIRTCAVWIGGQQKYFISTTLIEADLLMKVCFEMIARGVHNAEEKAKTTHTAFEFLHPFEDGNGRVGRILYNIHRIKLGLDIHIIHEGDEQYEYYKWFN